MGAFVIFRNCYCILTVLGFPVISSSRVAKQGVQCANSELKHLHLVVEILNVTVFGENAWGVFTNFTLKDIERISAFDHYN